MDYQEYLRRIVELTKKAANPEATGAYPAPMNTPGKRALYDNLDKDETLALSVDAALRSSRQDDWRNNPFKIKKVRNAIRATLELTAEQVGVVVREPLAVHGPQPTETLEDRTERILSLVKKHDEY
jgi:type I restriction enzyme R subunit